MKRVPVTLASALAQAGADLAAQTPPLELPSRLLAAVQARRDAARHAVAVVAQGSSLSSAPSSAPASEPSTRAPARRSWAWGTALASVSLLAGSALLVWRVPPALPPVDTTGTLRADGFLPLVPADRWPRYDTPGWIISTELQGERLAALGLPYDPARAGDSVRAELLVRPTGEVLAVRFLR